MKTLARKTKGFTLVEIMIVVGIIGILIAIAIPGFLNAREKSQMRGCQENLFQIDGMKDVWGLQNKKSSTDTPGWTDLVGVSLFLKRTPVCPGGGAYTVNALSTPPSCSLSASGHILTAN
jgi:prepilin-type N-terminal cleavage/methylation domain-containing protein